LYKGLLTVEIAVTIVLLIAVGSYITRKQTYMDHLAGALRAHLPEAHPTKQ
jgi:hypothetical protein